MTLYSGAKAKWKQARRKRRILITVAVSLVAALLTSLGVYIFADILEKKEEAKHVYTAVVDITDDISSAAEWGKNFPLQYEGYLKTTDQVRTKFGGSEAIPKSPNPADPRSVVSQSRLEEDPRLKTMWDGYAFSKDFREERGHAFMLEDQLYTERQKVVQQPGACINCHASTYVAMKKLGDGDLEKGFHKLNSMPYSEAKNHIQHPVACIDCHTPKTMELRITRPAFMAGIRLVKETQGIKNYDVNKMASLQEKRTYVCAQCHVEYYFKGTEKDLTFPWKEGLQADQILSYYDKNGHKDWVHKRTGLRPFSWKDFRVV